MKTAIQTRRAFLGGCTALAGYALLPRPMSAFLKIPDGATDPAAEDRRICRRRFSQASALSLGGEPIGDVITAMGRSFLGSPYFAHTLEVPGDEHLVVNLREFDCVTFVESTLSLARAIKTGHPDFGSFEHQLQTVRYRSGIIDGYPSRLHYFMDWIADNSSKKIVRDITGDIGGVKGRKTFDFMSSHRELYRQLSNDDFLSKIREREKELSSIEYAVLPKEKIRIAQGLIRNGDIIAIALSTPGIDVAHTGIACADGKSLRLMHASESAGKVEISKRSLADLVAAGRAYTGILVARPLEPES